jgi:hypothetical protein
MKIKIVSDGTGPGTHVLDENNMMIEHVVSVNWCIEHPGALATARLVIAGVSVVLDGDTDE